MKEMSDTFDEAFHSVLHLAMNKSVAFILLFENEMLRSSFLFGNRSKKMFFSFNNNILSSRDHISLFLNERFSFVSKHGANRVTMKGF